VKIGLVLLLCAACAEDGGPKLDTVSPVAAGHGATVALMGQRLCQARPTCSGLGGEVQLGLDVPSYQAAIVSSTDERWEFRVPSIIPAGETQVIVIVSGRSSNALSFEVLP
jgi:hypothetical protein